MSLGLEVSLSEPAPFEGLPASRAMLAGSPKPSVLGPMKFFSEAPVSASRVEVCLLESFSGIARTTDGLSALDLCDLRS
jgi:hypothetical protein